MKEMEKFFIFRVPRGLGTTKKNSRFFFLLSFLFLFFLTSTT